MNFVWWIYLFCYVASAINGSNISITRKATAQTIVADRRRYSMSKNRHHQDQHQNIWVAPLLSQTHCFQRAVPLWRNKHAVSSRSYINILDFRLLTYSRNLILSRHSISVSLSYKKWTRVMGNKAMNVLIVVCWFMTLCSLAGVCHFEIICYFHLKGRKWRLCILLKHWQQPAKLYGVK
jgi:hypothetical protein